jgi:prolipoprotein diacylglyceryltransferase
MWLPNERGTWAWRIPVQLLEFATALTLLALCVALRPVMRTPGTLFLVAMAGYATARVALQALRDGQPDARGLDAQTAISFALIVVALSALTWMS